MQSKLFLIVMALFVGMLGGCSSSDDPVSDGSIDNTAGDNRTDTVSDNAGNCYCQACCSTQPAGKYFTKVTGLVTKLSTAAPAPASGVTVKIVSPLDALTNPNPTALDTKTSGNDGTFASSCFDVTTVGLGLVALVDAPADYFPTGTGVKGWGTAPSEKTCVEGAKVFAVTKTLVTALDTATITQSATKGIAMGFVVDKTGAFVGGATLKFMTGTATLNVKYPNATMTDFSGTSTNAQNGMYIIPDMPAGVQSITAVKDGLTFVAHSAALKPGFVYFLIVQAQ